MPQLRAIQAREATIRRRALTAAYSNFERTFRRIDRLERLAKRLGWSGVIDLMLEIKYLITAACAPRSSRYSPHGALKQNCG